jgi:hypothetical protein
MGWESGELSLDELVARHPRTDLPELISLFERLSAEGAVTTPDPETSWAVLSARLHEPERAAARTLMRWRAKRVVALALTAGVLGGTSIAYAAGVSPIRHGIDRTIDGVTRLFGGGGSSGGGFSPAPSVGSDHDANGGAAGGATSGGTDHVASGPSGQNHHGGGGHDHSGQGTQGGGSGSGDGGSSGGGSGGGGSGSGGSSDGGSSHDGSGQDSSGSSGGGSSQDGGSGQSPGSGDGPSPSDQGSPGSG